MTDPVGLHGFLFDADRCTGCAACSLACSTENGLDWGTSWRQIVDFNPERRPGVPSFHLSLACNHCAEAPCVRHCPTGAMRRDPSTGVVVVDEARCIGCRYCAWVCPYDAPRFDEEAGVMTKCTFCNHRLAEGKEPACVTACPTDALRWGPLDAPALEVRIPGFPQADVGARIRFVPPRRTTPPESTWAPPPEPPEPLRGEPAPGPSALSLRTELPLVVFTTGFAGLAGWIGAAALGAVTVPLPAFVAVAAALLAISTLHLGRPLRAWRALRNLGTSALSREIALVQAFLALATLWVAWGGAGGASLLPGTPAPAVLGSFGVAAALFGWAALAAVDAVYHAVPAWRRAHSANVVLTGPMVAAAALGSLGPFGLFAIVKLALWGRRASSLRCGGLLGAVRVAGLIGPMALWSAVPTASPAWALLLVLAGELVDRADFYRTLEIPGPRKTAREEADRLAVRRAVATWSRS